MKRTQSAARAHVKTLHSSATYAEPWLDLANDLTTDAQNYNELLSAVATTLSQLEATALPEPMTKATARLRAALTEMEATR